MGGVLGPRHAGSGRRVSARFVLVVLTVSVSLTPPVRAQERFVINAEESVVVVGNTFAEQMV